MDVDFILFRLHSLETDVLYLLAICERVSPGRTLQYCACLSLASVVLWE